MLLYDSLIEIIKYINKRMAPIGNAAGKRNVPVRNNFSPKSKLSLINNFSFKFFVIKNQIKDFYKDY